MRQNITLLVRRVALVQQQLGEIGAVLAGDAGDDCGFVGHLIPPGPG
jgi:hypothetical protein